MKIELTPNTATVTAQTVSGPVTLTLRKNSRMPDGIWRQYASHSPRRRWQTSTPGYSQLTI